MISISKERRKPDNPLAVGYVHHGALCTLASSDSLLCGRAADRTPMGGFVHALARALVQHFEAPRPDGSARST